MNDKKRWLGLIGLLVLVALVVAACGGATATPDAMTDEGSSEVMMENPGGSETMDSEGDSDDMMKEDDSEEMMDSASNSDEMMKEGGSQETMDSESNSDDMMKEESGSEEMMDSGSNSDDMMKEAGSDETMDSEGDADDMMKQEGDSEEMMDSESDSQEMMGDDQAMMDLPAWFSSELTNATNGQAFSIADMEDKVVLVETMAIWCSNCLRQQAEVKALHEALGPRDDLVTVVLDIDPNENAQNLKTYSEKNGFDWTYAVAPREVAREIGQLYGDQFLNPPSTPMLIIDRHGEAHPLPFGIKSADELQQALAPFLSEGM